MLKLIRETVIKSFTEQPFKPATPFKLTTTFKRGASLRGLRQYIFTAAQETFAYDAEVTYVVTGNQCAAAITGASDLNVVLYFEDRKDALRMRNLIFGRTQAMGVT